MTQQNRNNTNTILSLCIKTIYFQCINLKKGSQKFNMLSAFENARRKIANHVYAEVDGVLESFTQQGQKSDDFFVEELDPANNPITAREGLRPTHSSLKDDLTRTFTVSGINSAGQLLSPHSNTAYFQVIGSSGDGNTYRYSIPQTRETAATHTACRNAASANAEINTGRYVGNHSDNIVKLSYAEGRLKAESIADQQSRLQELSRTR
jgi:hypothetical protein